MVKSFKMSCMPKMQKIIFLLFALLLFFVPIVLWPFTSEVFEFNKMVLVYGLTVLICAAWGIRSIQEGKFIHSRTILDKPLLIFLGVQFISTILSIDPATSWLGYYSRFNGGFLSTICYSLLYWAFVSNFDEKDTIRLIKITLASSVIVSLYGVLEHFGIDKQYWVQDVQSRVFSSLGQPNWLAAWIVALMPVTWAFILKEKSKSYAYWIYFLISILLFWTLIFTKSRSGILGVGVAGLTFWGGILFYSKKNLTEIFKPVLTVGLSLLAICLISGTQWTPSIAGILNSKSAPVQKEVQGPALETGGTESGTIRKIVWKGAVDVWSHYPVFGTGVETFAYSYYQFRPKEHNTVSEWDFIYNKAHNEFLNMAANTGTLGLLSYLGLIVFSVIIFIKGLKSQKYFALALLSGYLSLSATNFFGFSVVPTQLEFYLFPAFLFALTAGDRAESTTKKTNLSGGQVVSVAAIVGLAGYLLITITNYWYADYFYSMGKAYNGTKQIGTAIKYLNDAISLEPGQALYHNELATAYSSTALGYNQQKDASSAAKFAELAISESQKAVSLSPANLNLKRTQFGIYVMMSTLNQNYLLNARAVLIDAIKSAPTDAKLYYNLGLTYARTGMMDLALSTLKTTVELKPNYREARLAYAILLIDKKETAEAKTQLQYILTYIDPTDSMAKQQLESIK